MDLRDALHGRLCTRCGARQGFVLDIEPCAAEVRRQASSSIEAMLGDVYLSLGTHSDTCPVRYAFRRAPETPSAGQGMCHLVMQPFPEDFEMWLRVLHRSPLNRLVHLINDPAVLVGSAYLAHYHGDLSWTRSEECSRELCTLPTSWTTGLTTEEVQAQMSAVQAAPWLRSHGCAHGNATAYQPCLRNSSFANGLLIEASRARDDLEAMVAWHEISRGPHTYLRRPL